MINRIPENNLNSFLQIQTKTKKSDTYSYFSKASGSKKKDKKSDTSTSSNESKKLPPALIDTTDRIKLSLEAREPSESKPQRESYGKNPLNMEAFLENIGMNPPEEKGQKTVSLAQKLELLSLKTAGSGW